MAERGEKLIRLGHDLGITINQDQAGLLIAYMDEILKKNKVINLTSITDQEDFMILHLLDSLSLLGLIPKESVTIIDVGTGGGFPGIPLAIMCKEAKLTLLDSTQKKLKVIDEIAKKLGIANVRVVHGRAEEVGRAEKYRASFDLVVSRAVADLAVLSEYCLPLLKEEGVFLAMKGKDYQSEVDRSKKAISQLGGQVKAIKKDFLLQRDYDHVIIVIEKIKITPYKYPRHSGKIKKTPLG